MGTAKSVLVCEDEPLIALDVQSAFEAAGWRVTGPFRTQGDALRSLETHRPDVALIDLHLDGGDSRALIEELNAAGIPVVIYSGDSADEVSARYPWAMCIAKPFAMDEVLSLVAQAAG